MKISWFILGGVLLVSAQGIAAITAQTGTQPERVRISYDAPMGCPSKAVLMAQVAGRVTISWLADETELARHIRLVVEPSDTEFVARMEYVDESGQRVTRSVQAPNCEQTVAAIALVTAMAIEFQVAQPASLDRESLDGHQAVGKRMLCVRGGQPRIDGNYPCASPCMLRGGRVGVEHQEM